MALLLAFDLFVCLVGFLTSLSTTRLNGGRTQDRASATHETERGDYDFCFSRSHYTDTDPTSRERAATAGLAFNMIDLLFYHLATHDQVVHEDQSPWLGLHAAEISKLFDQEF